MLQPTALQNDKDNNNNNNNDNDSGNARGPADFSWETAKTFWIILIIAAIISLLHVVYKIDKSRRYKMHAPDSLWNRWQETKRKKNKMDCRDPEGQW
ncbi:hypothetical protein ACJQWK_02241 [Exserohilum turcicum]